ncbi:hypothetical protein ABZU75_40960 [Streptosporangium sp. NPDC005286]
MPVEFLSDEVFTPLARADQRVKGITYLRGLPGDGSGHPGAARVVRVPGY